MDNIRDKTEIAYKDFCNKNMTRPPHETKQLKTLLFLLVTGILSLIIL